ncbi:MAG: polysaccharide pyruvyl transferase CsaB [Cyanobacteria bacterium P01_F01_bin.150]
MRAVLCGYYGMGNGGDEALLHTLLAMLPPHVTPIVLSGNPNDTAQIYGVKAYQRKNLVQVINALRDADAFIWGGGSLMQDATSALNPLYYGGLMLLAQVLGLKTIAWGQGIGPLKRSPTRWLTRYCLRHCTAVSVRDSKSLALVEGWNISATLAPDPVWAMSSGKEMSNDKAVDHKFPSKDIHKSNQGSYQKTVAVILRPHPLLNEQRLMHLTQAIVQFQQETQTHILLVPFQPVNDGAIATHIQSQLPGSSEIVEQKNPKLLHDVFGRVDMAIAMRLHGAIMAISAGCQCWAISYDPKVTQLINELDLPGWELSQLPDSHTMAQAWIEYYQQTQTQSTSGSQEGSLNSEKIKELGDRARLHQQILQTVLKPD